MIGKVRSSVGGSFFSIACIQISHQWSAIEVHQRIIFITKREKHDHWSPLELQYEWFLKHKRCAFQHLQYRINKAVISVNIPPHRAFSSNRGPSPASGNKWPPAARHVSPPPKLGLSFPLCAQRQAAQQSITRGTSDSGPNFEREESGSGWSNAWGSTWITTR